jgi:hypothetical protein
MSVVFVHASAHHPQSSPGQHVNAGYRIPATFRRFLAVASTAASFFRFQHVRIALDNVEVVKNTFLICSSLLQATLAEFFVVLSFV